MQNSIPNSHAVLLCVEGFIFFSKGILLMPKNPNKNPSKNLLLLTASAILLLENNSGIDEIISKTDIKQSKNESCEFDSTNRFKNATRSEPAPDVIKNSP